MVEVEGLGRAVTKAEARVLSVLFESSIGPEEGRIRRSELSRTTYQVAKKRLYEIGAVEDRYVPNPLAYGLEATTFVLAVPFAETLPSVSAALTKEPGSVVVWLGRQSVLGVMFHRTAEDADLALEGIREHAENRFVAIHATADSSQVISYFDFEGAWNKLSGQSRALGYPRPLGGRLGKGFFGGGMPGSSDVDATRTLIRGSADPNLPDRAPHLLGPHLLPRSQRKLLQRNWVLWRVFPVINNLPSLTGDNPTDVIFMTGRIREGKDPAGLFSRLAVDCRTFPFLYCSDRENLLLGALGMGMGVPRQSTGGESHRSIMGTVKEFLEGINIVRESARAIAVQLDHRYDRALGESSKAHSDRTTQ